MEASDALNPRHVSSSNDPGDSALLSSLENVAHSGPSLDIQSQPNAQADLSMDVGGSAKPMAHDITDEARAKKRAEKKAMKRALKQQTGREQATPTPDVSNGEPGDGLDALKLEEQLKARKNELKEAKRALKEAKKLNKQLGKENKEAKKRQRSPSPSAQVEGTRNGIDEPDQPLERLEKQKSKRLKFDAGAGEIESTDAHKTVEIGQEKKKKRKRDAELAQITSGAGSGETSRSESHAQEKAKRRKPLSSLSETESTTRGNNLSALVIDPTGGSAPSPLSNPMMATVPLPSSNAQLQQSPAAAASSRPASTNESSNQSSAPPLPATLQQACDELTEVSEEYGPPVQLPQAQAGFYSTVYYPQRTQPLQVPTGKLSKKAREERYKGLTEDEITDREREYEKLSQNCPRVFQEAFKHTARGRLDKIAHQWLVPRVQNYYYTQPDGRTGVLDRIIRDLLNEFRDLHPNFLKLKNSSMEKDYLTSLRNMVSVAASGIKSALGNATKVENIDKDVIKFLTGSKVPPRAHDLWWKSIVKKQKKEAEERGEDDADQTDDQGTGSCNVLAEWEIAWNEVVKIHGKKEAGNQRLKIEQEFRKEKFDKRPPEEKKVWEDLAAAAEKPFDRMTVIMNGLPYINHVFKRFTEIAEVPIFVMLGAPDFRNPRQVIIYTDSYSPAPSDVPDFLNGPDRFGETVLVPAFRSFVEQCIGGEADSVAKQVVPLPTAPEPSSEPVEQVDEPVQMQVEEGPTFGVTARSGVRFCITPSPKDWKVSSKELDNARKEIRAFLGNSYKKAYNRQRCNFAAVSARVDEYIDLSMLPTTKIVVVREADGTTSFREAELAQIVFPTDPSAMPWYHVQAWFDLLKNPNSRFLWKVEESTPAVNVINPPKSVKESLEKPVSDEHVVQKAGKAKRASKSTRNPTEHSQPPADPLNGPTAVAPTKPKTKSKVKAAPGESEDEAVSSGASVESSPFSLKNDSAADDSEDSNPNTAHVLRPETISRFGRRSAPPSAISAGGSSGAGGNNVTLAPIAQDDNDSDGSRTEPEDTTRPAPLAQRPNTSARRSDALLLSPEKNSLTCSQPILPKSPKPYIVKPHAEPNATNIPTDLQAMLERVRDVSSLPKISRAAMTPSLNLYDALICCVRLDVLFPARQLSTLSLPSPSGLGSTPQNPLKRFWTELNNPHKPVPLCLAATTMATNAGTNIRSIALDVETAALSLVDILEGHDLVEDGEFGPNSFLSWTQYLMLLARYLKFIQSVEPTERSEGSENLGILHERVLDLTIVHLVLRYCAGTIISHIVSFPAPSASPSIANAISTLGSSWIQMVKRLSCPINHLSFSQVCGTNWAQAVNPSGQPADRQPFSHLDNSSQRWLSIIPSSELYDAIIELEKDLHSDPDLINEMSIYEQFTFVASVFAIHTNENIRGSDEDWLGIVDKLLEVIESQQGGGNKHEIELNPRQPPPTLISSGQTDPVIQKRERPRPYDKNSWHPGDTAMAIVEGKEQEVVFAVKQKYGGSRSLVMANPKTMKELFAPDGETALSLPPFSDDSLVSRGPNDPIALARFRVPGHWELPNLQFADTRRPEFAAYFAQFQRFSDSNDDPDELENLGFKPPEYFVNQYHEAQAAKESVNLPTNTTPHPLDDVPVIASGKPDTVVTSHALNAGATAEGGFHEAGEEGNHLAPGGKESLEGMTEDVESVKASEDSGKQGGSDEDGPVEPVQEGEEEEEVENVLGEDVQIENASSSKPTGNVSKASKKTGSKKEKGKQTPSSKPNNTKPKSAAPKQPARTKERPISTRSSRRLRTADTDAGQPPQAGPSQNARRMSLRNKDLSDPTPQTTRGPGTRSKKL